MADYVIKPFLKKTLNKLLKEFFKRRSVLSDFEWSKQAEGGRKVPLPETEVDGLVEAIGQLDSNDRLRVEQEFRDIRGLANEESNFCLIEQVSAGYPYQGGEGKNASLITVTARKR